MSFIGLGMVNVRRNMGRSVLAVASMAIASLVVTSLLSLAPSGHQAGYLTERILMGGDIVITGFQVITSAQDLDAKRVPEGSWQLARPPHELAGILAEAVPWPWQYGYLAPEGNPEASGPGALLQRAAVDALLAELAGHARVATVQAMTILPVLEGGIGASAGGAGGQDPEWQLGFVVGRDPGADREAWSVLDGPMLAEGRYLQPSDHGLLTAVTDARRTSRGYPAVRTGGRIQVMIPQAILGSDPRDLVFDYGNLQPVSLEVVGQLDSQTSVELTASGPIPLHWGSGIIMVSQDTLSQLAAQAGLDHAPVNAVAVRLKDLVHLDRLVSELRRSHPELVVFAVRDLVRSVRLTGATEPLLMLDTQVSGSMLTASLIPRTAPLNLGLVFAALAFTIAALIVAANLLVLLTARRKEISILRAVGASTVDVAMMVLSEAVFISLAGCVLGFWPVRLLATITLVSNRLSLGRIAALTFADFGIVCGAAMALALLFGLLPAIASTRMTPTEALRND